MPHPLLTRAKALLAALANGPLGAWFLTLLLPFFLIAIVGLTLLLGPILGPLDESWESDEEPEEMSAEARQQWIQQEQAEFERKRLESEKDRVESERARMKSQFQEMNAERERQAKPE